MSKKYHVFDITRDDIDDAIRQSYKQLKDLSETDEEYKENKKMFNRTRREMKEHPKVYYNEIMGLVMKDFEEIEHKFHGRFFDRVQQYMTSSHDGKALANANANTKQTKSQDANMDM